MIRENTEGIYAGEGGFLRKGTPHEIATQGSVNTRFGVERCVRFAFELAQRAPVGISRSCTRRTCSRSPAISGSARSTRSRPSTPTSTTAYNHVDAACIYFVADPGRYDVIVTDNLFGDILTDLAGAVAGGIGLAGSANLNPARTGPSMFEPVHGSAHDIVGTGKANPRAAILSAAMMLEFLGETDAGRPHPEGSGRRPTTIPGTTAEIGDRIAGKGVEQCHLQKVDKIWMDGELVDWDDAKIHVLTHTLHYGCGVFEGIRAYETDDGAAVFRLTDHIERLFNSAKIFMIDIPFTVEQLVEATKETVRVNNCEPATSGRSCTSATARWGSTRCRARSTCRSRCGRGARTSATRASSTASG